MVNGTLYGDGSAMLSSTFCEYCFCIRGKSTCLKPKCHLVIDGCTPHYDSHYSCCPSRYDCCKYLIFEFCFFSLYFSTTLCYFVFMFFFILERKYRKNTDCCRFCSKYRVFPTMKQKPLNDLLNQKTYFKCSVFKFKCILVYEKSFKYPRQNYFTKF